MYVVSTKIVCRFNSELIHDQCLLISQFKNISWWHWVQLKGTTSELINLEPLHSRVKSYIFQVVKDQKLVNRSDSNCKESDFYIDFWINSEPDLFWNNLIITILDISFACDSELLACDSELFISTSFVYRCSAACNVVTIALLRVS